MKQKNTLIIALEEKGGYLFNGRRLSSDKNLITDILNDFPDKKIFMDEKSIPLFEGKYNSVLDFADRKNPNTDFVYFAEFDLPESIINTVDTIVIYKWNRRYPADKFFDKKILSDFNLISTYDFPGNSHEKLTNFIYKRKEKNE